jgi:hypothetical protein
LKIPALTFTLLAMAAACVPTEECNESQPSRLFYLDEDGDEYGAAEVYLCADPFEARPDDVSPFGGDCDDSDDQVHPDASEVCDGIDNDCDGDTDANAIDAPTWHEDGDGDGYGAEWNGPTQCAQPPGHVGNPDDCDDGDPMSYPGTIGCP